MIIFIALLTKLIPLYLIIFLGFVAGRYLDVKKESISALLIYIISPIIVFNGVATTKITLSTLSLPILFFVICCSISLLFLWIGSLYWHDSTKNILAFTAGSGNTGYFGLPVALAIFDNSMIGLVILSILGFILYENTVGFYITAKGQHTIKESLLKVVKLPAIYAYILGLLINVTGFQPNSIYIDAINYFKGTYTVLGMMLIGLGLTYFASYKFDFRFTGLAFLAKFFIWPLIIFFVIFLDNNILKLYGGSIHKVMVLMATVPLAANTVAFATQLKTQPEKAALAVLLSTIFALFYTPLIAVLFLK